MRSEPQPAVDVAEAVDRFGRAIRNFFTEASRSTLSASLFDVPRRSEMASISYFECVAPYLSRIEAAASPEEIGAKMRRPGLRPNPLHVIGTLWLMFFRREQLRLCGDPAWNARDEELAEVVRFNVRALRAARGGEEFVPLPPRMTMPLIDPRQAIALGSEARALDPEELRKVRRLAGMLELFSFVLHGENRDGNFTHGPYELGDGRWLLVRDFTDLRNDALPWSTAETRLSRPALTLALVGALGEVEIDLWGTPHLRGGDLWDAVTHAVVLDAASGTGGVLGSEQIEHLTEQAQKAQVAVFNAVIEWPAAQRESYGVRLFAEFLTPIAALAGAPPRVGEEMVRAMESSAQRYRAEAGGWRIWRHLAEGEGSPFTPLGRAG